MVWRNFSYFTLRSWIMFACTRFTIFPPLEMDCFTFAVRTKNTYKWIWNVSIFHAFSNEFHTIQPPHTSTNRNQSRTSTQNYFGMTDETLKLPFFTEICAIVWYVCLCVVFFVCVCVYWCGLYLVHLPLNNHNLSNAMHEV